MVYTVFLKFRVNTIYGVGTSCIKSYSNGVGYPVGLGQRVLNDIWKIRLFCCRMILLLVHPLPSLSRQKSSLSFPVFLCVAGRTWTYWQEKGKGAGARSQVIRPRESLALHKLFNALWSRFSVPFCLDHRVGRVLSFFSIRRNWDSPNP